MPPSSDDAGRDAWPLECHETEATGCLVPNDPTPRLAPDPARVAALGEVFTPTWLVRDILDLVPATWMQRIEAKCLDPACGHGQFLLVALRRKLAEVRRSLPAERKGPMDSEAYWERSLLSLASIYGVDIDLANVHDARDRLRRLLLHDHREALDVDAQADYERAATFVLKRNIVHADFLADDFPVTEFRPAGDSGRFLMVTAPFSQQLPSSDPRSQPLFASAGGTIEGPMHWRSFHSGDGAAGGNERAKR